MRCKSCTSHFWGQFALAMLLLLPGVVAKSAFHSASIQLENVRAVERIAKRVSNVAKPRNESPVLTKSEKNQKEAAEISSHTHTHTDASRAALSHCPPLLPPLCVSITKRGTRIAKKKKEGEGKKEKRLKINFTPLLA